MLKSCSLIANTFKTMVEQEEAQKTRNWADVNEEAEEDGEGEAIGQSPLPQTEE